MLDGGGDCFQYALPVSHHIMVVEAKYAKAFTCKKRVTTGVALHMWGLEMLTSIELDYEACGMADEIHDIRADRYLPTKARALHAMRAQSSPYQPFGIGRVGSQRPCPDALLCRHLPTWRFR